MVSLVVLVSINIIVSIKKNNSVTSELGGGLLSSGQGSDSKKAEKSGENNTTGGKKANNKILKRINFLAKEIKSLKGLIQKLIQDGGTSKPGDDEEGNEEPGNPGGQGNQQTHKKIDGLQKVVSQLSKAFSNLGAQVTEVSQKQDQLTQTVTTSTQTIEKKVDSLEQKIEAQPSGGSSDLTSVRESLDDLKTKYLATLLNKTPLVTYEDYLKFFWLNTKVELVADHSGSTHIGGADSMIAIKNHNSHLIGTEGKGILIVENGKKVYEGAFASGSNDILNAVYVGDCDCYFLILKGKLYRKEINGLSLELWINGGFGFTAWGQHSTLAYSEKHRRILTMKQPKTLVIIDPKTKEIEFEMVPNFGDHIMNAKFFGENDEYIMFVTLNRYVGILKYDSNQKKGQILTKAHYSGHSGEYGTSLDIDSSNKIILASSYICGASYCRMTQITAFEFWNERLTKTASLNVLDETYWMKGFRYVKNHKNQAIFVGVDSGVGGTTHTYRYDSYKRVIHEDIQKEVPTQEHAIWALKKHKNWFYYTGSDGKLMRLKIFDGREE